MAKFQIGRADDHTAMQILSRLATAASSLPGCRGCTFIRGAETSSPFILVEEWDSEERLGRHVASEGFRSVLVHFGISLRGPDEALPSDGITLRFSQSQSAVDLEDFARRMVGQPDDLRRDDDGDP